MSPEDPCPLHPHGDPCESDLTSSVFNQVFKSHSHPSFHYVSHDHTHLTSRSLKQSYPGIVLFEVFVRSLLVRIVSQGVVCVQSVDLCSSLIFRLCFFTNPGG